MLFRRRRRERCEQGRAKNSVLSELNQTEASRFTEASRGRRRREKAASAAVCSEERQRLARDREARREARRQRVAKRLDETEKREATEALEEIRLRLKEAHSSLHENLGRASEAAREKLKETEEKILSRTRERLSRRDEADEVDSQIPGGEAQGREAERAKLAARAKTLASMQEFFRDPESEEDFCEKLGEDFSLYQPTIEEAPHLEAARLRRLTGTAESELLTYSSEELAQTLRRLGNRLRRRSLSPAGLERSMRDLLARTGAKESPERIYAALLEIDECERQVKEEHFLLRLQVAGQEYLPECREKLRKADEERRLFAEKALNAKQILTEKSGLLALSRLTGAKYLLRLERQLVGMDLSSKGKLSEEETLLRQLREQWRSAAKQARREMWTAGEAENVYREIARLRRTMAEEEGYKDYLSFERGLASRLDDETELRAALREAICRELGLCFRQVTQKKRERRQSEASSLLSLIWERGGELVAPHTFPERKARKRRALPALSEDRRALLDEIYLLIGRLFHDAAGESRPAVAAGEIPPVAGSGDTAAVPETCGHEVRDEKEVLRPYGEKNRPFALLRDELLADFPRSLERAGLLRFAPARRATGSRSNCLLFPRPCEELPDPHAFSPVFRNRERESVFDLSKLRLPLCLLSEAEHVWDLWGWMSALGRSYRRLQAGEEDLLLLEEKALDEVEAFAGLGFEMLLWRKIEAGSYALQEYIEQLSRRARMEDPGNYRYKALVARMQLERLSPLRGKLREELRARSAFLRRRLERVLEDLLFYAAVDTFEERYYAASGTFAEGELPKLWEQCMKAYFPEKSRVFALHDPRVAELLLFEPRSAREKWMAHYAALFFWDLAGKNLSRSVDAFIRFCRRSDHKSFTDLLRETDCEELSEAAKCKRLAYQLARILEKEDDI